MFYDKHKTEYVILLCSIFKIYPNKEKWKKIRKKEIIF